MDEQTQRGWDRWLEAHLVNERAMMIEAIGQAIATIRASLRAEIGVLRAQPGGQADSKGD